MSENITFARPYARAVYDLASEEGRVAQWGATLSLIAKAATQIDAAGLVGDPRITDPSMVQIVADLCGGALDGQGKNLVRLLVENRRLASAADLAAMFEQFRAQGEGVIKAHVVSARLLTEAQREALVAALKQKLGRDITLSTEEDETLLAGAIVRAGDLVIDGSLKGRLEQLAQTMSR